MLLNNTMFLNNNLVRSVSLEPEEDAHEGAVEIRGRTRKPPLDGGFESRCCHLRS